MARNTAEYNALIKQFDKIALSFESDLTHTSSKLISVGLITPSQGKAMINTSVKAEDRAAELCHTILTKVAQNSANFYKFVEVLRESGPMYTDIVRNLQLNDSKKRQTKSREIDSGIRIILLLYHSRIIILNMAVFTLKERVHGY